MVTEEDDNVIRWETESPAYIDLPEDLTQRMYDIVNAVAHGHESMFLMAEATHIVAAVDRLMRPVIQSKDDDD